MTEWERPHWSGRPQPQPKTDARRRLKPNVFARLARVCVLNPAMVLVAVLFLSALMGSIALLNLRFDPGQPARIVLDAQTRNAQGLLDRNFPGIEKTFVAHIELADAAAAHDRAMTVAAALAKRSDLFAHVFVPGTGAFYQKYAILFRDVAGIEASVTRTLRMQPLYQALASAPDLAGLASLVNEIGRAVSQGRSPPGLSGVLLAASATVETEINGKPRPIDWPALAGLSSSVESKRWFVIATPLAGKEREAAWVAAATTKPGADLRWYFPLEVQAGAVDILRELMIPASLALVALCFILSAGLGSVKFTVPIIVTVFVSLCLTAGAAALIAPNLDAATWAFAPAGMAPGLLFSIIVVLTHMQARRRGAEPLTAVMLAAQRQGPLLLVLAAVAEIFVLTWLFRQLPSLAQTAAIGGIGIAVALILSLTLLPTTLIAVDRGGEIQGHWLDGAVGAPLGPHLQNGRQILVLVVVAASLFCGVFVPGLRFGDGPRPIMQQAPLDTPAAQDAVHFLVAAGASAQRAVEQLSKLPQVGTIRWIEQFLPMEAERKLQELRQLNGFLADLPAPNMAPADAIPGETFTALETGLRQIADDPAAVTDLREASHRLRRALSLYSNSESPTPANIKVLEAALFSGLADLTGRAAEFSRLSSPAVADFDDRFRRRFVSPGGHWRIEVLPKPGVRRLAFAGAMRKFSLQAAGTPIVALARSEIMHHETALAVAMAFIAAAIAVLLYLRDILDWIISLVPLLFAISLSAAVAAATGYIIAAPALVGAMAAMALCLSMSVMLVLWARQERPSPSDTMLRAAVLPPVAFLGVAALLMIPAMPAVSAFGQAAVLFLSAAIALNLIFVPQACAWAGALRRH